jgi:hypothetical protein
MNDSANLFLEKIETLELQIETLESKIETLESKVISLEDKNSKYIKEISNRFIKISEKLIILSDKLSAAKEEKFNRDEQTSNVMPSTGFIEIDKSVDEPEVLRMVSRDHEPHIEQINEKVKKIFSK